MSFAYHLKSPQLTINLTKIVIVIVTMTMIVTMILTMTVIVTVTMIVVTAWLVFYLSLKKPPTHN